MAPRDHIECWLTDMDGVLVAEQQALPGAAELLAQWRRERTPFLVLTNNSIFTARDLAARMRASGLEIDESSLWTSALATAEFLRQQRPGGSAFVIGEAGILTAMHDAGFIMTETAPDFVVVGETRNYSFDAITKAIRLIDAGARFIATNPDATGPTPDGVVPATGAITALITKATGKAPYVVGKPNPMMFRSALNKIGAHSENTAMIGDRMDTDIVAGMEAGLHTVLVLTGISELRSVAQYPFRPDEIISGVHELVAGDVARVATGADAGGAADAGDGARSGGARDHRGVVPDGLTTGAIRTAADDADDAGDTDDAGDDAER